MYVLSQEPNWGLSDDLVETFCDALQPEVPGRSFKLPSEGTAWQRDFVGLTTDHD